MNNILIRDSQIRFLRNLQTNLPFTNRLWEGCATGGHPQHHMLLFCGSLSSRIPKWQPFQMIISHFRILTTLMTVDYKHYTKRHTFFKLNIQNVTSKTMLLLQDKQLLAHIRFFLFHGEQLFASTLFLLFHDEQLLAYILLLLFHDEQLLVYILLLLFYDEQLLAYIHFFYYFITNSC